MKNLQSILLGAATLTVAGGLLVSTPAFASTVTIHPVDMKGRVIHSDITVDVIKEGTFEAGKEGLFNIPQIDGYRYPFSQQTFIESGDNTYLTMKYDVDEAHFNETYDYYWSQENGQWYYKNNFGDIRKGWFLATDGNWYFSDKTTGAMKTGWINDGGNWYYCWSNGQMASNTYVGGYHLNESGVWDY